MKITATLIIVAAALGAEVALAAPVVEHEAGGVDTVVGMTARGNAFVNLGLVLMAVPLC